METKLIDESVILLKVIPQDLEKGQGAVVSRSRKTGYTS